MCILFFVANACPESNGFRLVLVNNRDEHYTRPTKPADFWATNDKVIGGIDLFPGKTGGTWLAMHKSGRIGVLLNILQPVGKDDHEKRGRGFLVTDFVNSSEDAVSYLNKVRNEGHEYNTFNLVTIEMSPKDNMHYRVGHYTNIVNEDPVFLGPGEHGFGNSKRETPWRKVAEGKKKFIDIVARHKTVDTKDQLVAELFQLVNDRQTYFPDPQLESQGQGRSDTFLEPLSALGVHIPEVKYGTRTNTVILVDCHNQVSYIERTMKEPVDEDNPQWIVINHYFKLEDL